MAWWITVAKKNNNRIKTNAFPAKSKGKGIRNMRLLL
jgi:hypothetical protein